jgi:membrane protein
MSRILTKIQSAVYRATAVANARYRDDVLDLQAMSLTYSTLLSLVPFLAVMFSVLKAFEVQNVLEPFLMQMLQPLGPEASQVANRIIRFVDNIRVGILGAVGVAMLFYTVVTLVAKVEDALNQIWRLPRSRTWPQRVTAYLSVVLVGPVMVFTALTLTASAQSYWLIERLFEIGLFSYMFTLATSVMPFVLLCATFTFLYKLMPYTNVRFSSALVGGATAGILWQLVGMGFAAFVANSAQYAAVYSSFAIMIVFLIWLYVGWLIFLVGGEVTYFHQYPSVFAKRSSAEEGIDTRNGWPLRPLSRLHGDIFPTKILGNPPNWRTISESRVWRISLISLSEPVFCLGPRILKELHWRDRPKP